MSPVTPNLFKHVRVSTFVEVTQQQGNISCIVCKLGGLDFSIYQVCPCKSGIKSSTCCDFRGHYKSIGHSVLLQLLGNMKERANRKLLADYRDNEDESAIFLVDILAFLRAHPLRPFLNTRYNSGRRRTHQWELP